MTIQNKKKIHSTEKSDKLQEDYRTGFWPIFIYTYIGLFFINPSIFLRILVWPSQEYKLWVCYSLAVLRFVRIGRVWCRKIVSKKIKNHLNVSATDIAGSQLYYIILNLVFIIIFIVHNTRYLLSKALHNTAMFNASRSQMKLIVFMFHILTLNLN